MPTPDLKAMTTPQLLKLFAKLLRELRNRKIVRSANNPVADYSELLACRALGLELVTKSTKGYDATDSAGRRYEVKGRRLTPENQSRQLSAVRALDERHFDHLVGIVFEEDFSIRRACVVPAATVEQIAKYQEHTNSWVLNLTDSVWEVEGVRDVTKAVRKAAAS